MASKKSNTLTEEHRKQAAERSEGATDALRSALGHLNQAGATWAGFTRDLQHAELVIRGLRFNGNRVLSGKRPEPTAFVLRDLIGHLTELADELDDPATPPARRKRIEETAASAQRAFVRGMNDFMSGSKEETYLRSVLCAAVESVASCWKDGTWTTAATDPAGRWAELAHEVVRLFSETVGPDYRERLRRNMPAISAAIAACCNKGGRGKVSAIPKSEALMNLCDAMGFAPVEYDSIRGAKSRKRGTKKKQV